MIPPEGWSREPHEYTDKGATELLGQLIHQLQTMDIPLRSVRQIRGGYVLGLMISIGTNIFEIKVKK